MTNQEWEPRFYELQGRIKFHERMIEQQVSQRRSDARKGGCAVLFLGTGISVVLGMLTGIAYIAMPAVMLISVVFGVISYIRESEGLGSARKDLQRLRVELEEWQRRRP